MAGARRWACARAERPGRCPRRSPTTSHSSSTPAFVVAMIFEAPETTWSLVRMIPFASMIDARAERLARALAGAGVEAEEEVVEDRGAAPQDLLGGDVDDGGGDLLDDVDDLVAPRRRGASRKPRRPRRAGGRRPAGVSRAAQRRSLIRRAFRIAEKKSPAARRGRNGPNGERLPAPRSVGRLRGSPPEILIVRGLASSRLGSSTLSSPSEKSAGSSRGPRCSAG